MARTLVPDVHADREDARVRFAEASLHLFRAYLRDELEGRHARRLLERPAEVILGEPGGLCEIGEAQFLVKARSHQILDAPDLRFGTPPRCARTVRRLRLYPRTS